ncbi:MAG: HupE/UreJ family protein [Halieaceae bacterium]
MTGLNTMLKAAVPFMRAAALLLPLLLAVDAQAHRFAPSLLRLIELEQDQYNVIWKTPAQRVSKVPLRPMFPDNCTVEAEAAGDLEGTGVVSSWRMQCVGGLLHRTLGVSGLLENQAAVLLSLETRDGYFYQTLLNGEQNSFEVPDEPTAVDVMREYSALGAEHIWGGIDHLLFVFGLLLLVGWGRRLVWTITAFTVGHSVTLSLVTLGYIEYPVALVEFAIAVSIFVLALELARSEGAGWFRRYPWWLAAGFGLLHGMGFAGALAEVGLPQAELPLALLFFNIGIELGQLAFIALAVAAWVLLKPLLASRQQELLPVPVYLLGSLSAMWCIERGLEIF